MMDINTGDIVSLRHFSGIGLIKGVVLEKNFDSISVKLIQPFEFFECDEGDPVVLGFELEHEVHVASCNITKITNEGTVLLLKIDNIEVLANKRLSERFPVSFYVDMRVGSSQINHVGLVKNISFTGMLVYSKSEFPLYQKLKVYLNLDDIEVSVQAIIVRKSKDNNNYEYGLKIVYTDVNTPNILKRYLLKLKKEQAEFIKNINDPNNSDGQD